MNDWLQSAHQSGWLDWDRLQPGAAALAVLLSHKQSPLRRRASDALANSEKGIRAGEKLYELLRDRWDALSLLSFALDDDRDCQGLLLDAFRWRFRGLSKLITVWMNVEVTADITTWLVSTSTEARDDLGRRVAATPLGVAFRVVYEEHEQINVPEDSSVVGGLILRRLIELVRRMPPRSPFPSWHPSLPDPVERKFIERAAQLDDQQRFVLLSTIYGDFTTEEIAIAFQGRADWPEPKTEVARIDAERRILDILRSAWRGVFQT